MKQKQSDPSITKPGDHYGASRRKKSSSRGRRTEHVSQCRPELWQVKVCVLTKHRAKKHGRKLRQWAEATANSTLAGATINMSESLQGVILLQSQKKNRGLTWRQVQ